MFIQRGQKKLTHYHVVEYMQLLLDITMHVVPRKQSRVNEINHINDAFLIF